MNYIIALITKFPKGTPVKLSNLIYVNDPGRYDRIETLFDKNDDYVSVSTGVILCHNGTLTSIKFTVDKDVTIYAISIAYKDSSGPSGGDLSIYKLENGA